MSSEKPLRVVPSTSSEDGPGVVKNVPGNAFNKHESSNPMVSWLMGRFHRGVIDAVGSYRPKTVLDVGCGEGRTTKIVYDAASVKITGVDIEEGVVLEARRNVPSVQFLSASAYDLPFPDDEFDVVMATEMLEHLDRPDQALAEMIRVSACGVVVTVPHEPWWRLANMARGRYLRTWGNTPGHVQHWSRSSLTEALQAHSEASTVSTVGLWLLGSIEV